MADIAGKTLLARQAQTLNQNHLTDITVVTGYASDKMKGEGISFLPNKNYKKGTELDSLLTAQDKMNNGFLLLYSDILVENHVIAQLLASKEDIVLVLDNSIQYLESVEGKATDYVISRNRQNKNRRSINFDHQNTIAQIGKNIDPATAPTNSSALPSFQRPGPSSSSRPITMY